MKHLSNLESITAAKFSISQLDIAVEIIKVYNCRACEVLSAKWKDFHPGSFLVLSGAKKSSNVIIRDRFILSLIERLPELDKEKIFPSLNYYHLYRHIKTHYSHLFVRWKKRKNFKVTHGFRYRAVKDVANDEEIRDILHHRSIKSGKFYK